MQIGSKARKPKRLVPDPTTSRNQNQLPTPQAWWAQRNPSPEHPAAELPPTRPVNRGAEALLEWYLESCRGLPRDLESSPPKAGKQRSRVGRHCAVYCLDCLGCVSGDSGQSLEQGSYLFLSPAGPVMPARLLSVVTHP